MAAAAATAQAHAAVARWWAWRVIGGLHKGAVKQPGGQEIGGSRQTLAMTTAHPWPLVAPSLVIEPLCRLRTWFHPARAPRVSLSRRAHSHTWGAPSPASRLLPWHSSSLPRTLLGGVIVIYHYHGQASTAQHSNGKLNPHRCVKTRNGPRSSRPLSSVGPVDAAAAALHRRWLLLLHAYRPDVDDDEDVGGEG